MANTTDLIKRRKVWYFNRAYPQELWSITGSSPFRKSLRTDSFEAAKRARPDAERLYWSKVDAVRASLDKHKPHQMTEMEAMGLVAKWFTEEDTERTAELEATRSPLMDIDGALAELDRYDSAARQNIAESDNIAVRPLAERLVAEAGLEADVKSREFKALMSALLRGRRELLRLERSRILGDYAVQPLDPLIAQVLNASMPPATGAKVRTVADMIDGYLADNTPKWSPSTLKATDAPLRILREFLGETSDLSSLTRDDGRAIFEIVKGLPTNFTKLSALKGLSIVDAVAKGKELALPTLAPKSINDVYLTYIGGAFRWATKEGWLSANLVEGLSVIDTVASENKRSPFTAAQINRLFQLGPWADPVEGRKGDPLRYWGPLIALYQGMRRSEIAQLQVADVEEVENVPVIQIRITVVGQSLKNAAARRTLPVHPELVRMGFLLFVTEQRQAEHSQLFPAETPNKRCLWGDSMGKWLGRLLKEHSFYGARLGMHSFRHNFEDALRAANLHGTPIGQELAGRAKADKVSGGYGGGRYPISILNPAMDSIRYPEMDLKHLYRSI